VANVSEAVGAVTVKKTALEVPPPGAGLVTVTAAVSGLATFAEGTVARSRLRLINLVASGIPFQFTTAPGTNALPFTVSVKHALPGLTLDGTRG
jgi:hypothetical protein